MSLIDTDAAPRVADYLLGLPAGFDSYPECQVRSEVTRDIFKKFPGVIASPALAPELRERLGEYARADWMPDVAGIVLRILVRDVACSSDEEYHRWAYDAAGEIFARPAYRMLMYVLSPTLVLMGATKRWSTFRRGSTLTSRFDRHSATAELRFPHNLYTPLVLEGFGHAFCASLAAARAQTPTIELTEAGPEIGRWAVSWK